MDPEHPKAGYAFPDRPINPRHLVDYTVREDRAQVITQSGVCNGVRHPIILPEAAGSSRSGQGSVRTPGTPNYAYTATKTGPPLGWYSAVGLDD